MARPYPLRWRRGRLNRKALVNCSIVHSRDDGRKVCAAERERESADGDARAVRGSLRVRYAGVPPYRRVDRYVHRALMPQVSISYRLH